MKISLIMMASATLFLSSLAGAREIRVPEMVASIQAAVDEAKPGDVVSVNSGIWNEAVDLKGKAITLRAREGDGKVILDGTELEDSVLRCLDGEGPETIIDGFMIMNGSGHRDLYGDKSAVGGGLLILGASPVIRNCQFINNDVNYNGGAIYMARGSRPQFENCIFDRNEAEKGGAIYSVQSQPMINGCTFRNNEGRYSGGAIYNADGTDAKINESRFESNRASYYGGAVYQYGSLASLKSCIFDRNRATYKGGAVCNGYKGFSTLVDCAQLTNHDDVSGGKAPHVTAVAPKGACVLGDGSCLIVSRQSCEDAAGSYRSDGSDCHGDGGTKMAHGNDLNRDGRIDDRDALMLLLLWR
ncbi:MAG: hypothetical protein CMJ29_13200 [Phycisphaerae bacterium]|nr:hypothetical protein [Phycisphaerae bacterium]|tara:strand:- start:251 stop:1321 length:1071 start_codon:yes stop_codon:yes gene_type:complete